MAELSQPLKHIAVRLLFPRKMDLWLSAGVCQEQRAPGDWQGVCGESPLQ